MSHDKTDKTADKSATFADAILRVPDLRAIVDESPSMLRDARSLAAEIRSLTARATIEAKDWPPAFKATLLEETENFAQLLDQGAALIERVRDAAQRELDAQPTTPALP